MFRIFAQWTKERIYCGYKYSFAYVTLIQQTETLRLQPDLCAPCIGKLAKGNIYPHFVEEGENILEVEGADGLNSPRVLR